MRVEIFFHFYSFDEFSIELKFTFCSFNFHLCALIIDTRRSNELDFYFDFRTLGSFINDVHQKMGFLDPLSPPIFIQKNFFCMKVSQNLRPSLPPKLWTSYMNDPFSDFIFLFLFLTIKSTCDKAMEIPKLCRDN